MIEIFRILPKLFQNPSKPQPFFVVVSVNQLLQLLLLELSRVICGSHRAETCHLLLYGLKEATARLKAEKYEKWTGKTLQCTICSSIYIIYTYILGSNLLVSCRNIMAQRRRVFVFFQQVFTMHGLFASHWVHSTLRLQRQKRVETPTKSGIKKHA